MSGNTKKGEGCIRRRLSIRQQHHDQLCLGLDDDRIGAEGNFDRRLLHHLVTLRIFNAFERRQIEKSVATLQMEKLRADFEASAKTELRVLTSRVTNWLTGVERRRPKIYRMPGTGLEKFARLVYKRRTFERVFQQELADMQDEYLKALERGDQWAARVAVARGWVYFGFAVLAHLPVSMIKRIWSLGS